MFIIQTIKGLQLFIHVLDLPLYYLNSDNNKFIKSLNCLMKSNSLKKPGKDNN